jgi:hypothetical protein
MPQEVLDRYARAAEAESFRRSVAMLGLAEVVGGFHLSPLTLRHYIILRAVRSPLLTVDGIPSPAELAAFLWLLHPDYNPTKGRKAFLRRCRRLVPPSLPIYRSKWTLRRFNRLTIETLARVAVVLDGCRQLVSHAFSERMPGKSAGGIQQTYYCDAVSIIGLIAREYGWTKEHIIQMPLIQLFQFSKEIHRYHNPESKLFNESDKIVHEWLASLNKDIPR